MTHNGEPRATLVEATLACLLAPGLLEAMHAREALSGRADHPTLIGLADAAYRDQIDDLPDPFATRVPLNLGQCHLEWGAVTGRRILEEVVRRSPGPWAAEAALDLAEVLRLPDLPRTTLYAIVVHAFGDRPDDERHALYEAFADLLRADSADAGIAAVEANGTLLLSEEIDALLTRVTADYTDDEAQRPLAELAWFTRLTLRTCQVFGTAESRDWRPAIAALQKLTDGTDEAELRGLLRRFPGLLSPVAAEFVADIGPQADPPGALHTAWRLLKARRAPGVDGVLDAAWDQGLLLPASLRVLVAEASAAGEPDDEGSTRRVQQAWSQVMSHPGLHGRLLPASALYEYATAQLACYRTGFAPEAVTTAIEELRKAVATEPSHAPGLSANRRLLAEALIDRYPAQGVSDDLREARSLLDRPPLPIQEWEELPFAHELLLCKLLMLWHDHLDAPGNPSTSLDDLERLVSLAGHVADSLAERSRDRIQEGWTAAVGEALLEFADEVGPVGDSVATAVADRLLASIHDDRLNLANSYVSGALTKLFRHTGRIEHLDRLVDLERRTACSRYGSPRTHAVHRANLGTTLLQRFTATRDASDLDEAVEELRQAIPLIPRPHAPRVQSMLSAALGARARITRGGSDMAEALDWGARSVEGTDPGHVEYANRNNNLGMLCLDHWELTGVPATLDRAIRHLELSVRHSAPTARGRVWRTLNLAVALAHRYEVRQQRRDFRRAHRFFSRVASATADAYPEVALKGLSFWGAHLARQRLWPQAATAYAQALRADEQLFRTQAFRDHKELWLAHSSGLATEAASALHRNGDRVGMVLALERGRARLLSESLGIDHLMAALLQDGHAELHHRYIAAVHRLRHLERSETA